MTSPNPDPSLRNSESKSLLSSGMGASSLFPSLSLPLFVLPPFYRIWCILALKMRSSGKNLNYFSENKLTKLAKLVQFKRMLMFCLENWERPGTPLYATVTVQLFADASEQT